VRKRVDAFPNCAVGILKAAPASRLVDPAPRLDVATLRRDVEHRAADVVRLLTGETEQAR
jgi:hypothetical protein